MCYGPYFSRALNQRIYISGFGIRILRTVEELVYRCQIAAYYVAWKLVEMKSVTGASRALSFS
jgi:hypothetical protein